MQVQLRDTPTQTVRPFQLGFIPQKLYKLFPIKEIYEQYTVWKLLWIWGQIMLWIKHVQGVNRSGGEGPHKAEMLMSSQQP